MTKLRKLLLGLAIAAAVTVPVGIAYAADGGGGGHHSPVSGMMTGGGMDPADCPHAGAGSHMGSGNMPMNGMHQQMRSGRMAHGSGTTCDHGSSTGSGT